MGPLPDDQVAAFARDGYLIWPAVVAGELLDQLRIETGALVDASATHPPIGEPFPTDFAYGTGPGSGRRMLRRVEYVIDRLPSCRRLLTHQPLLDAVRQLQGPDTIPTWDSMVVKMPGDGVAVPWHRDDSEDKVAGGPAIFNIDVYLDDADEHTSLWVLPGSHRWSDAHAGAEARRRMVSGGFDHRGAVQVPMRAGDVLLHDIRLVHGSPPSTGGALRRVVYYEFRPVATERAVGPHDEDYLTRKRAVLAACIAGEAPTQPGALRVAHEEHWRS